MHHSLIVNFILCYSRFKCRVEWKRSNFYYYPTSKNFLLKTWSYACTSLTIRPSHTSLKLTEIKTAKLKELHCFRFWCTSSPSPIGNCGSDRAEVLFWLFQLGPLLTFVLMTFDINFFTSLNACNSLIFTFQHFNFSSFISYAYLI